MTEPSSSMARLDLVAEAAASTSKAAGRKKLDTGASPGTHTQVTTALLLVLVGVLFCRRLV